jgi:protein-tyrosine phosphatase
MIYLIQLKYFIFFNQYPKRKMKILFVCTGNTCRSPMAAAYFSRLCKNAERDDVIVRSAGTFAGNGVPASGNAVKVMRDYGIDLENHRSKVLTRELLEDTDHVFTMTEGHRLQVMSIYPQAGEKTRLLMDFYDGGDVADPFGGSYDLYKDCFEQMKAALDSLFEQLIS